MSRDCRRCWMGVWGWATVWPVALSVEGAGSAAGAFTPVRVLIDSRLSVLRSPTGAERFCVPDVGEAPAGLLEGLLPIAGGEGEETGEGGGSDPGQVETPASERRPHRAEEAVDWSHA